jgi:LacI family transcriptional regulator
MATHKAGSGRPVGIRDVARVAGVSVAAASLALNGRSGVADETRRRAVAAARQLGYRANPQAQALRRGRTTTYGFVVRNFANPFFLEVLSGAQQVAAEAGATLLVLDSRYSIDRERRHVQEMAVQRVAGLAISPVGTGESIRLWQDLRPGAPVVSLNGSADAITGVTRVSPDTSAAVELPMRCLAELGHASVAFLSAPRHLMADPDRLRHFRRIADELGLQPRIMYSLLTMADVQQAAITLLSGGRAPTSIITNSDYTALAIYMAARELSLPIGPGVSVVGHDDLPTSEFLDPPLATIRMDQRAMGRALMMRLLEPGRQDDYIATVELVMRASGSRPLGHGFSEQDRLDGTAHYSYDTPAARLIALDTNCPAGGAAGCVDLDQARWLEARLAEVHSAYRGTDGREVRTGHDDRLVILFSHHGIDTLTNTRCVSAASAAGDRPLGSPELIAILHRFPNVVLWLNGHTHTNAVRARRGPGSPAGGFWEVTTCSVVDWPCQARLMELVEHDGCLSIVCTMVDHDTPVAARSLETSDDLAALHRELAANLPFGGAGSGLPGVADDRNVELRVAAPFPLLKRVAAG